MKKYMMFFLVFLFSFVSYAEEYVKGEVVSLEKIVEPDKEIQDVKSIKIFKIKILEGDQQGEEFLLEFPVYSEDAYNLDIKEKMNVVLYKEELEDGSITYYIADIDKRNWIYSLVGIFAGMTILFTGKKGFKALIALFLVVFLIYKGLIPGIILGYSPILLATLTALFASFITIYLMAGLSEKGIVAIFGSVIGVLFSGILSYVYTYKMGLTGYTSVESLSFAPLLTGIKIKEIISAGVILGSMGAVMDVAMSISSALDEIKMRSDNIDKKELFMTAMRIGSDVIGTMINTLVLAYIGSGILSSIFIYLQRDQYPLIRILNFESVVVDILRAVCGSIGIIVAVPVTAYFSGIINIKRDEK